MSRGFEAEPFVAAVEQGNWEMVGEIVTRTPEDKAMLGWAAANLLSDKLNFRTAAAMVYEKSPVDLQPEVVVNLQKAMDMEPEKDETLEARYYAAKALLEHEEITPAVSVVIEEAADCSDSDLAGLASECLNKLEQMKSEKA